MSSPDTANPPRCEVSGLVTGYRQSEILHGIGLHVGSGEIVGLVGPNGAGKSTLMKALAGVLPARAGSIRLEGQEVGRMHAPKRVRAGMVLVPEGREIFAPLSVAENLWLGGFNAPKARESTLALIYDMFPRLQERSAQIAGTLSGGEQQMLAIARGLMAGPTVLLIDEPSLGLAPVLVQSLIGHLRAIQHRFGLSMLVAEQGLGLTSRVCDRLYVLIEGRVAAEVPPDIEESELLSLYLGTARVSGPTPLLPTTSDRKASRP